MNACTYPADTIESTSAFVIPYPSWLTKFEPIAGRSVSLRRRLMTWFCVVMFKEILRYQRKAKILNRFWPVDETLNFTVLYCRYFSIIRHSLKTFHEVLRFYPSNNSEKLYFNLAYEAFPNPLFEALQIRWSKAMLYCMLAAYWESPVTKLSSVVPTFQAVLFP